MSEKEKLRLIEKLNQGLEKSYEALLARKAVLGEEMVTADTDGQPVTIPASEFLKKEIKTDKE